MKKELQSFEEEFFRSIREKEVWKNISENEDLPWDADFINMHKDNLDWDALCGNEAIYWNVDLIEKYKFRIDWTILSANIFESRYNSPQRFNWEIFKKFENRWNWHELSKNSYNIPVVIIEEFAGNWDWKELIDNDRIPWSFELFNKYKKYISLIDFDVLNQSRMWEQLIKIEEKILIGKLLSE